MNMNMDMDMDMDMDMNTMWFSPPHVPFQRPNLRTIEFTRNVSLFDRPIATPPT